MFFLKNWKIIQQQQKLMWLVSGENNYCKQIFFKSVVLLILPKHLSSWCTINENEIHIRKMDPFQSGDLGKGARGRGNGSVSAPPVKMVVICIYFKQVTKEWNWGLSSGDHQDVLICGPFSAQKQWNPPVLIFTAKVLLLNNTIFTNSMQQIQQ